MKHSIMDAEYKAMPSRCHAFMQVCNSGCYSTVGYFLNTTIEQKDCVLRFLQLVMQQACHEQPFGQFGTTLFDLLATSYLSSSSSIFVAP